MANQRNVIGIFVLLAAPFYLNDFFNIFVTNWKTWLTLDFLTVKLFPCIIIFWTIFTNQVSTASIGISASKPMVFIFATFLASIAGILLDQRMYGWISDFPGYHRLGGMPGITNPWWNWVDLTIGLFLVAAFEELVFRSYAKKALEQFTQNRLLIIAFSAMAFGLIHWSSGFHAIMVTALIGAIFMAIYIRCTSILPLIFAHFMVNFVAFKLRPLIHSFQ